MQEIDEKEFENEYFYLKEDLDEEEKNAIIWKTGWAMHINSYLRNSDMDSELEQEYINKISILDNAFKKSILKKDMILYRNLHINDLLYSNNIRLCNLHKGKVLVDKGYMECSFIELDKMYDADAQLIIEVKQNTNCISVATYSHRTYEMGILFPRDTKIKVLKVRRYFWGKWKWKIYCEIV